MAVYEHTLVCRCLKVNASSLREKNIRGSEPREQVRTARRGSRNPQGRTLFSMTGSRFYLLDFLRSKSNQQFIFTEVICQWAKTSVALLFRLSPKQYNVLPNRAQCQKKANTNTFRNLRRAPRRRRVGALHRIAPVAAKRCSSVCLRKRNGCMQHEHLPNLPWSLPAL